MRSFGSAVLVRITWALTITALLALSISAGLFDLSRPAQAAGAALSSPAGQRLAADFIADQLLTAVPGLSRRQADQLAATVAADPATLGALKQADLGAASPLQDRAALLGVVASRLKQSNPKVAAATQKYADQIEADAAADRADPASRAAAELPSPIGGLLERVRQFTGDAPDVSTVMSDLKQKLAQSARLLAAAAVLTALAALALASSRAPVVRSLGWMLISVSLVPAAIGWVLPDLVLARMSSDWAQALAVGLRVGGSRLLGLFVGLLFAGLVLLVLGSFGTRVTTMAATRAPHRDPDRAPAPYLGASVPEAGRPRTANGQFGAGKFGAGQFGAGQFGDGQFGAGQPAAAEPAVTRPIETGRQYPDGWYPDPGSDGEQPGDHDPYRRPGSRDDRWR